MENINKHKFKLAIFDLDGTLLDTLKDIHTSVNLALEANNMPTKTLQEVKGFVGNGSKKLIERSVVAGTDSIIEAKVFDDFKKFYDIHCNDTTKPYDGILDVLAQLKTDGVTLAMLSNKPDFAVQKLNKIYFRDLFDIARGSFPDVPVKPAPDSVINIITSLNFSKNEVVYVGDSEVDIQTAANAKIDEIAVTWGFKTKDFLVENKATTFAHKTTDLINLI